MQKKKPLRNKEKFKIGPGPNSNKQNNTSFSLIKKSYF